jgi:hypothetical protein
MKMKKIILLANLTLFSLSATATFALTESPDRPGNDETISANAENTLSESEVNQLTIRIEQIRDMDKSSLTKLEKRELKQELKDMKKNLRKASGGIYIGAGTLLVILLVVLLLA